MSNTFKTVNVLDPKGVAQYTDETGYFFPIEKVGNDFKVLGLNECRDEFGAVFTDKMEYVGWADDCTNISYMKLFWDIIANKLGDNARVEFARTQFPNLIIVKLPKFWTENFLVRAVFTLLLRASSSKYNRGNFENALATYRLSKRARPALNWFLAGNTKPNFEKFTIERKPWHRTGFVAEFETEPDSVLAQKMIRPPDSIGKVTIQDGNGYLGYKSDNGYFFPLEVKFGQYHVTNIFDCRESFGDYFGNATEYFGWRSNNLNLAKMNEFWDKITSFLGEHTRPKFFQAQLENLILVQVPEFWRANDTRQGFFTLFLRCSAVYYQGDFEKALSNYHLSNNIQFAVKHFLAGYTTPTFGSLGYVSGRGKGIVAQFSDKHVSQNEVEKMLIKA